MARHIAGIDVVLHDRTLVGHDAFNAPLYEDTQITVSNVLVAPMSSTEVLETLELTGSRAVYQLAIPKGDTRDWSVGKKVTFFGEDWRIIALPTKGIDDLIPLDWNLKVQVERYG
jgi:hypothetical protein